MNYNFSNINFIGNLNIYEDKKEKAAIAPVTLNNKLA
jgi:hypothetical protein